jgi:predicted dehydrogenase
MTGGPVKIGIIGLGRWARVLTRSARTSDRLVIARGFSRSAEKRAAFEAEYGVPSAPDLGTLLADPEIRGVILTVPNEQHLPVAEAAARAGKHVYTEKPIANTLANGLAIEALEERHGIKVMVGHSARLLKGTRAMRTAIDRGELGRIVMFEANFSNERALELTPGAGTGTARRAGRCRSSPSTSSTACIISAARSPMSARSPPSCRRSAPRSTTSR